MTEKLDPVAVGKCALQSQELSLLLAPVFFHGFVRSHCFNMQRQGLCIPQVSQIAAWLLSSRKITKFMPFLTPSTQRTGVISSLSDLSCFLLFPQTKTSDICHISYVVDTEY